jgi:hypothetical protein
VKPLVFSMDKRAYQFHFIMAPGRPQNTILQAMQWPRKCDITL